ncbi:site-specific integrase [Alteromonas portus]|uniref:Site-specific integrase n=1 Tax=Alteromonas portus TaxID=2565549 RepID=A0A4U0ZM14_9ALTE|nr:MULTISPECIES: site-specific integrase [Alteromonas]TKB04902.1 site-specific integrase [Alteromonas portus]USI29673.1 site-specific integrase [Alteromonas macleodii]
MEQIFNVMKNCLLVPMPNGKSRLIDVRKPSDSMPIDVFTQYQDKLFERYPSQQTRVAYRGHVARFIDYLIECGVLLSELVPEESVLNEVVHDYPELLEKAEKSSKLYLQQAAKSLGRKPLKSTSEALAAINYFLEFVVDLAENTKSYVAEVLGEKPDGNVELFAALKHEKSVSMHEIRRIQQNSILGANLRKIKKFRRGSRLQQVGKSQNKRKGSAKDFPIEHIEELLLRTENIRDRAFWALMAGGGLRQSEALVLKWDLVDFENKRIRIEDPNNLRGSHDYHSSHKLAWKGRETANVYLLPILKDILFDALLKLKYQPPFSSDGLVFLKETDDEYGQPLFEAQNKTLNEAFRAAQNRIGLDLELTLHSLRHLYGVFLKNDFPDFERGQIGLSDSEVQLMMGHASPFSTAIYARQRQDKILMKMEILDRELRGEQPENLNQMVAKWHLDKAMQLTESVELNSCLPTRHFAV